MSRIETIDSPDLIFAVADHVGLVSRAEKENSFCRMDEETFKSTHAKMETKRFGEERLQAINLAKWID